MALPAELRISIFEYALKEDNRIPISDHVNQPPLLSISRQVRREALPLWYQVNSFIMTVRDCDATLLRQFSRHCIALDLEPSADILLEGEVKWPALLQWCQWIEKGETHSMDSIAGKEGGCYGRTKSVVMAAHHIAWEIHPWAWCERALESLRFAVEAVAK
jgi:hypothetical protein